MKDTPDAAERLQTVLRASGLPTLNSLACRLGLKRGENLYQIRPVSAKNSPEESIAYILSFR